MQYIFLKWEFFFHSQFSYKNYILRFFVCRYSGFLRDCIRDAENIQFTKIGWIEQNPSFSGQLLFERRAIFVKCLHIKILCLYIPLDGLIRSFNPLKKSFLKKRDKGQKIDALGHGKKYFLSAVFVLSDASVYFFVCFQLAM